MWNDKIHYHSQCDLLTSIIFSAWQAVCCSDMEHCCPNGYTCNVPKQRCDKGSKSVKWMLKTMASATDQIIAGAVAYDKVDTIICPDHQSMCPDGSTCCPESGGVYGCCPLPNVRFTINPLFLRYGCSYSKLEYSYLITGAKKLWLFTIPELNFSWGLSLSPESCPLLLLLTFLW